MVLHDAVAGLQADAEASGLVVAIGQDAVQAIMSEAFEPRHNCPDVPLELRSRDNCPCLAADRVPDLPPAEYSDFSSEGFWRLCREADERQARRPQHTQAQPRDIPTSTLQAAEWLVSYRTAKEFDAWLLRHPPAERAEIVAHFIKRRRA
jgi:hypothetical protein